jgi:hypothetical protein
MINLQTALLDLLQKVHDSEVRLIAGGGFGIYLKTYQLTSLVKNQNSVRYRFGFCVAAEALWLSIAH